MRRAGHRRNTRANAAAPPSPPPRPPRLAVQVLRGRVRQHEHARLDARVRARPGGRQPGKRLHRAARELPRARPEVVCVERRRRQGRGGEGGLAVRACETLVKPRPPARATPAVAHRAASTASGTASRRTALGRSRERGERQSGGAVCSSCARDYTAFQRRTAAALTRRLARDPLRDAAVVPPLQRQPRQRAPPRLGRDRNTLCRARGREVRGRRVGCVEARRGRHVCCRMPPTPQPRAHRSFASRRGA